MVFGYGDDTPRSEYRRLVHIQNAYGKDLLIGQRSLVRHPNADTVTRLYFNVQARGGPQCISAQVEATVVGGARSRNQRVGEGVARIRVRGRKVADRGIGSGIFGDCRGGKGNVGGSGVGNRTGRGYGTRTT